MLNKPKIRLNFAADYRPLCLPPPNPQLGVVTAKHAQCAGEFL